MATHALNTEDLEQAIQVLRQLIKPREERMTSYLIDGPIMTTPERRQALVDRMAKDLAAGQVFLDMDDSVRALRGWGYSMIDVALLVADARMVAFQDLVAKEMANG